MEVACCDGGVGLSWRRRRRVSGRRGGSRCRRRRVSGRRGGCVSGGRCGRGRRGGCVSGGRSGRRRRGRCWCGSGRRRRGRCWCGSGRRRWGRCWCGSGSRRWGWSRRGSRRVRRGRRRRRCRGVSSSRSRSGRWCRRRLQGGWRRSLALLVASPADWRAVLLQPAGVLLSRAYLHERLVVGGGGLAVSVLAPADGHSFRRQGAGVPPST